MSSEVAARGRGLRTGFTTGTCASAAAKAAAVGLLTGRVPATVEVGLPDGSRVTFAVEHAGSVAPDGPARAAVVKDAGDDPDCTHGAHLTAEVSWLADGAGAAVLEAGPGVGTVTKPGLGIPVGEPAITPVPRRMIRAALAEAGGAASSPAPGPGAGPGLRVVLSVPGGERMAEKTTNARLGIIGGISILGTTGIVRPFSTAAYRASVVQQIDVAAAQGERHLVLCTGSRSERAAFRLFASLDPVCVVEVGDFSGIALRRAAGRGVPRLTVVAMVGKIAKLAAGVMMTHFHRSAVDGDLLAEVARRSEAPPAVVAAARETNTARHFFEVCIDTGCRRPLDLLCALAARNCAAHAGGGQQVDVLMVDYEGDEVVARG
jgi:cobalt-precorrin-5B (C1)-methyltransferase